MKPNRTLHRLTLSILALAVAVSPYAASADTAANTTVRNVVTVTYNDEGGNAQPAITAYADFTVTLKTASPLLVQAADVTVLQSRAVTLTYTITATANGPDTYQVTATPTQLRMQAAATPALPVDFILGGTTLADAAVAGSFTIVVPYDGNPANTSINGLAPGDDIVVGGVEYEIADNGILKNPGTNTATITLETAISAGAAAGSIVGERATFDIGINSGLIAGTNTDGTHSITATVTSTTAGSATVTQGTATVVTVTRPLLTVEKFVSVDGGDNFALSASAPPGTSLTYKVVVTNGGASDADAVVISDVLPRFLAYLAGSAKVGASAAARYTDVGLTDLTDNVGGYTVAGSNLSYAAGTVSRTPGSNVLVLFYQATIE